MKRDKEAEMVNLIPGSIVVGGATTLARYSQEILMQGLRTLGRPAILASFSSPQPEDASAIGIEELCDANVPAIIQLHGSREAQREDAIFLDVAFSRLEALKVPTILLCHRPDELAERLSEQIADWESSFPPETHGAVVLLGPLLAECDFVKRTKLPCEVIPHGFFEVPSLLQEDPVIIGAHTTWGEMRSLAHAVKLLAAVYAQAQAARIPLPIGYLGGIPHELLTLQGLDDAFKAAGVGEIEIVNVRHAAVPLSSPKRPLLLVGLEREMPADMGLTFNLQMYGLGSAVRLGESSGSLHRGVSIPVVLEMNGAEELEDLKVVKVPYSSQRNIDSAQWDEAAGAIIGLIRSKDYRELLVHNAAQAKRLSPSYVAQRYLELITELT